MNVYPDGLPHPLATAFSAGLEPGLARIEMSGGVARASRDFAHLPQAYDVTWRLTRAQRATLVAFFDEIGVEEFFCPLHVPGDPRPWRSVQARLASDLSVSLATPSHDDVRATLTVEKVVVVLAWGALLSPDGSPIVAPSGVPVHYEELG